MKEKIAVITHKNPDYDAICSSSSIANYLEKISDNNEVYLILEKNKLIQNLFGGVKYYQIEDIENIDFDSIYVCDVNEKDRTYGLEILDKVPKDKRILIDHHDKNREELDIPLENRVIKPAYSSTCEIMIENLDVNKIDSNAAKNLYMGVLSDTAGLTRNVTENTQAMLEKLNLDEKTKLEIQSIVCSLSEEQQEFYDQIETLDLGVDNISAYTLFSDRDITSLIKHPKFDELTKPTNEKPVSIFIIGVQNNYFIKFKKTEECDVDILSLATSCNGGGHENRCAGRFYNTTYEEVLNTLNELLKNNKKLQKSLF